MKKIDHKIISDMFRKRISDLENEIRKIWYRSNKTDKSHKRDLKRKLIQTKKAYDRFKLKPQKKKKK